MKKLLLGLTCSILLASCGEAQKITVQSERIDNIRGYSYVLGSNEINPLINVLSLVSYPNDNEIPKNFSYTIDEDRFNESFSRLKYKNNIPRKILATDTQFQKSKKVMELILATSNINDIRSFEIKQAKKIKKQLVAKQVEVVEQFPCFESRKQRRKCLKEDDGQRGTKKKIASSCSQFKQWKRKFVDMTPEDNDRYESVYSSCLSELAFDKIYSERGCFKVISGENSGKCKTKADASTQPIATLPTNCTDLENNFSLFVDNIAKQDTWKKMYELDIEACKNTRSSKNREDFLDEKTAELKNSKKSSSVIVVDVFNAISALTKDESYVAEAATLDSAGEDAEEEDVSVIRFSEDYTSVEELKIKINWKIAGVDNSSDTGGDIYSIDNGKITNVRLYIEKHGVQEITKLDFNIEIGNGVTAEVTSAHTDGLDDFDDRFIGDLIVKFPSGKQRKGLFRLDLVDL